MRKKKIVGGALIVLVLLLMTGCGGGGRTSEKSAGKNGSASAVSGAAAGDASGRDASGADATDGATGESALAERSREFAEQIVAGLYTPVWEAFSVNLANELPERACRLPGTVWRRGWTVFRELSGWMRQRMGSTRS